MNGRRYFLDTNAIVQILSGNRELLALLMDAEYVATSVICELEFLSFPLLLEEDAALFSQFIKRVEVIDNGVLKNKILKIRSSRKVKLPDAIIAASSLTSGCTLVTADRQLLNMAGLDVKSYTV